LKTNELVAGADDFFEVEKIFAEKKMGINH
jgi:hypothetical protein